MDLVWAEQAHKIWGSQDLKTACSAAKISLLLQQLKPLYGLCEAYLLLLLIEMHESKEERCSLWAEPDFSGSFLFS